MQKFYIVDFDTYYGTGNVREVEFPKDCPYIKKDGKGYIYRNEELSLSRCLYKTKREAEYVLMLLEQD